ncbi:hypothetical protein HHI36_017433, partial [Cryptolaemus montrouzieri]
KKGIIQDVTVLCKLSIGSVHRAISARIKINLKREIMKMTAKKKKWTGIRDKTSYQQAIKKNLDDIENPIEDVNTSVDDLNTKINEALTEAHEKSRGSQGRINENLSLSSKELMHKEGK